MDNAYKGLKKLCTVPDHDALAFPQHAPPAGTFLCSRRSIGRFFKSQSTLNLHLMLPCRSRFLWVCIVGLGTIHTVSASIHKLLPALSLRSHIVS